MCVIHKLCGRRSAGGVLLLDMPLSYGQARACPRHKDPRMTVVPLTLAVLWTREGGVRGTAGGRTRRTRVHSDELRRQLFEPQRRGPMRHASRGGGAQAWHALARAGLFCAAGVS